jgi:CheY-like chemotaxis protein
MSNFARPITVLYADDDPEDRFLVKEAWRESRLANELHFVEDGEEMLDYLHRRGKYAGLSGAPLPGMILLDLNMPRMDGREALQHIKADAHLRLIPTVILTTSKAEEDIFRAYNLGVNSFIVKPVTFQALVDLALAFERYWFEIVELPPREQFDGRSWDGDPDVARLPG